MKVLSRYKTADGVPISEVDGDVFCIRDTDVVGYTIKEIRIDHEGAVVNRVRLSGHHPTFGSFAVLAWQCYASEAAAWKKVIANAQESSNSIVTRAAERLAALGGK